MTQTIEELVKGHRDAITVKRVFGEPFQKDGVTVIPAAKVMGGGGGGRGRVSGQWSRIRNRLWDRGQACGRVCGAW